MADQELKDRLNPVFTHTQELFIRSNAHITALIGPQGEGKTFAGAWRMYEYSHAHFAQNGEKATWIIIRDTWENINRWTLPAILEALPFMVMPRNGNKELVGHFLHAYLIGMQDYASLAKLQGAQPSGVWLEEPAPYVDRGNAGLALEVFDVSISRAGRQRFSLPSVQITMNPADEYHWTTTELITNPRFPSKKYPTWTLETFQIPYGENRSLTDKQREGAKAAFARNEGLAMRFIEGKPAFVQIGEAVCPEFNPMIHVSTVPLEPMQGVPGFRFWDGGLNPTCIVAQVTPGGSVMVLDTFVGANMGVGQLIRHWLEPLLNSDRYHGVVPVWRDIGDPAMLARDQIYADTSPARAIEDLLGTAFEAGPVAWANRREAVKAALTRFAGNSGVPFVVIDPRDRYLARSLRGGWHYARSNSGQVLRDAPVKDEHSHPGDAFGYGMAVILQMVRDLGQDGRPIDLATERFRRNKRNNAMLRSYSTGVR